MQGSSWLWGISCRGCLWLCINMFNQWFQHLCLNWAW